MLLDKNLPPASEGAEEGIAAGCSCSAFPSGAGALMDAIAAARPGQAAAVFLQTS